MSSKFIILQKLLQQVIFEERKKVLVFSGFDGGLDCCEQLLEELEIQFLRLDGSTSAAVRKYNIHLFNKNTRFKVFLVATKAGGEGVTLTAAEVVVFLDLDWNPQVIRQAEARAHRIGQTRPVTVYKLCTRGTVEAQMISRLNKKLYLDAKVNNQFVNHTSPVRTSLDEPTLTDTEVIRNLIRTSIKSVAVEQMNAEQMLHWNFEDILDYCSVTKLAENDDEASNMLMTPSSPQECFDDEKMWLSKSERIKTDFFHGIRIPRSPTTPTRQFHIETEGKRISKTRVIFNREHGYHVSKESMLCGEWEAVPTLAGKEPSLADYKAPPKSKFIHEKVNI
jgi:superfamily II DNA/RNA helicase